MHGNGTWDALAKIADSRTTLSDIAVMTHRGIRPDFQKASLLLVVMLVVTVSFQYALADVWMGERVTGVVWSNSPIVVAIGIGLKTGMHNIGGPGCSDYDFGKNVDIYEGSSRDAAGSFLNEYGDTASREGGNFLKDRIGYLLESRRGAMDFLHDKCDIPMSHLEKYGQLKQSMIDSLSMIGYDMYLKAAGAAYSIPDWVKKTAGWWSERKVSDGEFVNGLTYLIKNKVIQVPKVDSNVADQTQNIPDWVRTNAAYWADGQITDKDFVNGIQYLIQHKIIRV